MNFLLDHMLGKKIQRILIKQGHLAYRAIELDLHQVINGKLYEKSLELNCILVTCDSDFDNQNIGKIGHKSIIYLKPSPNTNLRYLIPLIENYLPEINEEFLNDYLIGITNDGITYNKFEN